MTDAQKLYLHIGLHKTGTTYLQSVCRVNRQALREQGLEFPAGPGEPSQSLAVWDLQGRRPRGTVDDRIPGMWSALVRHVESSPLPTVLISEERLSVCSARQAKKVVDAFSGRDIEVIVTARDIGRVAVSAWQEGIKNESAHRWAEFIEAITDPVLATRNPARSFWLRQDLVKICAVWENVLSAERLHIVTVPGAGEAPPSLLLERYASVVGFDAAALTAQPRSVNEAVGVASNEVLRRLNQRIAGRLNQRQYDHLMRRTLVPPMAQTAKGSRPELPAEDLPWASAHARETIAELRAREYPVAGDLEDLMPRLAADARRPDDARPDEVLESALDAIASLAESYAKQLTSPASNRRQVAPKTRQPASGVRAAVFRLQQKASRLADRNALAHKALMLGMRLRRGSSRATRPS
jgi:hypothetical protein